MARFVKSDVVVVPFPFSDLSGSKRKPALVLADLPGSDIILCQITSRFRKDVFSIPLSSIDFATGNLPVESYVRVNRIFTADKNIIIRKVGSLRKSVTDDVQQAVISIFSS